MLASVKALLSSIVDYAGLFPPAKLSLPEAMATYAQDQMAAYCWMLGQFVLPASRLNEFVALLPTFPLKQWSLSAILSGEVELEIEKIKSFDQDAIAITALEFPPLLPPQIQHLLPHLPVGVDAFFEIPLSQDLKPYLAVLQHPGVSAKIRTGGITPAAFPSAAQLAQAIVALITAGIPFKATAGLHHPLPANHPVTYAPDSPATLMHGFLNVAILAAIANQQKVTLAEALDILQISSIKGCEFTEDQIIWRDRHLNIAELAASRQHCFRSFGSCSFQEPIEDLKKLNLI